MLSPETGRLAFRIAVFIVSVAGGLLLFLAPGSAEFVLSTLMFGVGLLFLIVIIVLVRRSNR